MMHTLTRTYAHSPSHTNCSRHSVEDRNIFRKVAQEFGIRGGAERDERFHHLELGLDSGVKGLCVRACAVRVVDFCVFIGVVYIVRQGCVEEV